jgi:antitoxin MazE
MIDLTSPHLQVSQTVQEWGNGLGVCLTAPVAKALSLARGARVVVHVVEGGIFIAPELQKPTAPTLEELLASYDPALLKGQHADFDADEPVGKERFWE